MSCTPTRTPVVIAGYFGREEPNLETKYPFAQPLKQNPPLTSQRLTRSIRCLKLDGFVVDYLPFEQELSRIALLTCGKDCIDSGLRAPKTPRTPHSKQCPYTIYIGDRN